MKFIKYLPVNTFLKIPYNFQVLWLITISMRSPDK